ncbi:MAG TPA: PP2C family protein-serine/threonine phosphatase [Bacteroidota bacterium]|nr:PP2C family protein-serine/threonine phosphatase [Bacteroidota bacterium]
MPPPAHKNPGLISTLKDDISQGGFFAKLRREAEDIEDFYLSDEERTQLKNKSRFWRWFVLAWWIIKNSFLRLSPVRRLLLVLGVILVGANFSVSSDSGSVVIHYSFLGLLILLLVLILELKDKLLAHGELESGRAVQQAMTPENTPSVPGWHVWLFTRSANEVGGDLVDFLRLNGSRSGIAIGDVAGKGLGAALFMVKIQATLRALAPDYESLTDLASKLNGILLRDGMPTKFASLLFARIDSATGTLRYVNAGHMPPLVVSQDGVTELPKGNVALGLSEDAVYTDQEVPLAHGLSFIVYSDGVTEAQNERGEFYGIDRLKTVCVQISSLSAQALGEQIVADVARFEGEARRNDDLSLVILQRSA